MMVSTRRAIHSFHIKAASMSRNAEIKSSVAPLQKKVFRQERGKSEEPVQIQCKADNQQQKARCVKSPG
ncbi:hypothetical protein CLOSTMETH_00334 [[Clostridium] methylpentosum DSM 5476]|uniref:Uncharacterized protein n=1 Tax=[Clostridium] methylpentosum DSM 5476 TaxID=537013 RepID=C0E939_9FIRM|nr:hypothetical protein CLOSTMETH_00334 [[Clostridium] methylpentosum DSM 5476]